jgi:alkylated DNA repair dioxygenase AlkB
LTGQPDLFGPWLPPGLAYAEEAITRGEEERLISQIDRAELEPFRFQQWTGKRRTRSFGWTYDFTTGRFAPADPIPAWLAECRERAAAFAAIAPEKLVQALLIAYAPGAGIGWHRDRPVFDHVIGLSLGAPATLRLRRRIGEKFERAALPLAPRSIYHLSREARHEWEHSIAPMESARWSITFRSLK